MAAKTNKQETELKEDPKVPGALFETTPVWNGEAFTVVKESDNLYRVFRIEIDSKNRYSSQPELVKDCSSRTEAIEYFKMAVVKAGLFG